MSYDIFIHLLFGSTESYKENVDNGISTLSAGKKP